MINVNFNSSYLDNDEVNLLVFGDSSCNSYIPINSLFTGKVIRKDSEKILLYNIYVSGKEPNNARRRSGFSLVRPSFDNLYNSLAYESSISYFISEKTELQVCKGVLLEYSRFTSEFKLLMVLAVQKEHLWNINKDAPDLSKFILLINNDFANADNEKYTSIYKKIKKEYISEAILKGIDVMYTNSIEKICYNHILEQPKFKSIQDMKEQMDKLNQLIYA